MGCSAMRLSTSRNQANGSIRTSSQEETKLRSTAAVLPPLSLPKKVQLLRPTAKPFSLYISSGPITHPDFAALDHSHDAGGEIDHIAKGILLVDSNRPDMNSCTDRETLVSGMLP